MNDSLYMTFISCLPRKRVGRMMGVLAGWEGSSLISRRVAHWFADRYQLDMEEAAEPLEAYPNLHSLFTRRLKAGARPIDPDPRAIVSPVDGIVAECGVIEADRCTQVKGRHYTIDDLLGGAAQGQPFHHGYFLTIYLSPRHYHRIHAPVSGAVVRYHHLPGHLFPVNAPSVRSVDRLFVINERLVSYIRTGGPGSPEVAVVKVGAIGVGRISVAYAEAVTNRPGQLASEVTLPSPWPVSRGDELAVFELGSTVILVFPPGMIQPEHPGVGSEVKVGQRLALLAAGK